MTRADRGFADAAGSGVPDSGTYGQVASLFETPFFELLALAQSVHRSHNEPHRVEMNARADNRELAAAGARAGGDHPVSMGQSREDRIMVLVGLASPAEAPESMTISLPFADPGRDGLSASPDAPFDEIELVRTVAVARILLPESIIRLAPGQGPISDTGFALCILAGANAIDPATDPDAPGDGRVAALIARLELSTPA